MGRRVAAARRELEQEWGIAVGSAFSDATEAFVAEATLRRRHAGGAQAPRARVAVTRPRTRSRSCASPTVKAACGCCATTPCAARSCSSVSAARSTSSACRSAAARDPVPTATRVWRPAPDCGCRPAPRRVAGSSTSSRRPGRSSIARARSAPSSTPSRAPRGASPRIDDERAVLVHGDVHQWNALEAADGFKLVDPDGLLAEAEYDLGIIMREDPLELLDGDPHERARWLAARTGLDADRDLGMGRRRARVDRVAGHEGRPAAGRPGDARRRRSRRSVAGRPADRRLIDPG